MWPLNRNLAERVKEAMREYAPTRHLEVSVSERGGVITFQGQIPAENYRQILGYTAKGIKGAKEMDTSQLILVAPVPSEAAPAPVMATPDQSLGQGRPQSPGSGSPIGRCPHRCAAAGIRCGTKSATPT
ncbi:MAG: hypothetical protein Q6L60_05245 [Thermostichus sp. HHBFW_bins_43]